ncbi:MAG: hypothetical protein DCC68_19155 [Planctomycetota bacterium]|nr:MAG: hypothetical protein DCC68_19155 [Planctomycetota bacterium]
MSPRRRLRCESLEVRHVLDSVVVFNELMYNPVGADESLEWIELHNQMAIDIDLSAWRLTDGVNFTFDEDTIIPGHGYLVIAADPAALEAATGFADAVGPYTGRLDNNGESIRLRDRNDRELDRIDYHDEGAWPAGADGSGASLAKINQDSISGISSNWRASPQIGGTPGAVNFPTTTAPSTSVELISLDDTWNYDATNTDNGTAWRDPGFVVPGTWSAGQAVFGAGTGTLEGAQPELIAGVAATATSQYVADGRFASNTVNGSGLNPDGTHSSATSTMWLTNGSGVAPTDTSPEITFDLGAVYALEEMKVWNYNEYRPDLPTRILELLGRGVNRADILIAGADQVFTPFITNHQFPVVTDATTATDFSHTIDFGGVQARYIKFDIHSNHNGKDFNNPLSNDNLGNFVGLSEVQFFKTADPIATDVPLGATTYYFRKEFAFSGDAARTQLFLNLAADDGAVVFLNGVEVHRQNMLGGDVTHGTLASTAVGNPTVQGPITIPATNLVQGAGNVLAVEVHQTATGGDVDMVFGADLTAVISPPSPADLEVPLVLNEVGQGGTAAFFVEIGNRSSAAVDVGGYVIETTVGDEYVLPASMLAPGTLLSIPASQLGFTPAVGDRVFLKTPSRSLLADGFEVKSNVRGRSPDLAGVWGYPDVATPGGPNSVPIQDEIVINEIMYHHRPTYAKPGTPAQFEDTSLVPINATWKYNRQGGAGLPTGWQNTIYTVDGTIWRSGPGLIGRETTPAALPAPIGTDLATGYTSSVVAYYFQHEFNFAGAPAGATVRMRHVIDDGAIFYLNGVEIPGSRYLMPAGSVTGTTQALAPGVDNAGYSSFTEIPVAMFNLGNNVLSAEVHQLGTGSSDIVFGLELVLSEQIAPPIPGTTFSGNDEEWVELYNKSDHAVDISGWQFDDGIQFTFPANTIVQPGAYLVVARDAASLAAKYPAIAIAGSFAGELNNQDENLRLRDARGNIANEVHYYDGGRWSDSADGGGSSLELRDPDADNGIPEAWAASDEGSKSQWRTYTYTATPGTSAVGNDAYWDEFVLGMLDEGEVLLDDLTVTQLTGAGSPVQLLQNGTFESDALGASPAAWRMVGNHRHAQVVVDPTNPNNQVLRLDAGGSTEHMSNHAETTLKNGAAFVDIQAGAQYQISFRAKWLSGSPQLNTRLYFNRAVRTTILEQPENSGTPGAPNSRAAVNIGPTYRAFRHSPAVPAPLESVTVSALADDPEGVASMTLWYAISGGAWQSTAMALAGGKWTGTIPGQAASTVVQFYVEGQDSLGAASTFPADGRNARALYKVNDGLAATNGLHNFRMVLTAADTALLHAASNLMSNDRIGATVIYNENEIFYDVGVRLKGSEHSRVNQQRLGFNVSFNSDQLFRGVHKTVALDRSESTFFGQREMLSHQTMNHAGGILSKYHDLVQIMAPLAIHTGAAELQLARYGDEFLDEQFENGSDGTVFEYELIYNVSQASPSPEGNKIYTDGDGAVGISIRDMGDDSERYRWTYLIKNNTDKDDFAGIIAFAKAMGQTGTAFTSNIGNYIDVDQFLRGYAFSHLSGAGDSYSAAGDAHNVQFYVRPEDNKVLLFPHDLDAFYSATRPLVANADLTKLISVPGNAHMYYGHVHEMISTTYNLAYMTRWANHFGDLLPAQDFDGHLAFIGQRSAFLLGAINTAAGTQANNPFNITSPDATVNATVASISGTGWVNVRSIRKAGDPTNLAVTWNTVTGWTATVPVDFGTNVVTLEAYDFQDNLIGSDTVTITSTVSSRPLQDFLRVTELMYHPADPSTDELAAGFTDADQFEYIEFKNTSATETLNLAGAKLTNGVAFDFTGSAITSLAPGAFALVVVDQAAFTARYGAGLPIAGVYGGQLNNAGETIRIEDANAVAILDFTYDDTGEGWHPTTDGDGYSLVIVDPLGAASTWSDGAAWRPSGAIGGSPGSDDGLPGDFNSDGNVGVADLAILQAHLGTTSGATVAIGDIDGDGDVDRADAAEFARQFGRSTGVGGGSPAAPSALAVVRRAPTDTSRLAATRRGTTVRHVDAAIADLASDALSVNSATDARVSRVAANALRRAIRR